MTGARIKTQDAKGNNPILIIIDKTKKNSESISSPPVIMKPRNNIEPID